MTTINRTSDQEADGLRADLVDDIVARHAQLGIPMAEEVETALRIVPRHLFTPGVPLSKAYAHESVITKRDEERGINLSSVSAPAVVAMMLNQLQSAPGHRILEIGSGGYNAALLAELVGHRGAVTTIDIDPEVIDRAHRCLEVAGYFRVRTLCVDGQVGAGADAVFDRIIVTASAWDIPPAWVEQLAEGGRLVVPLRTRGLTRSWALESDGDHLVSRSHLMCGFVPMQGAGEHQGRAVSMHDGVGLWMDEDQRIDAEPLHGVLSAPRTQRWPGVIVGKGEPYHTQDLWLVTQPDFCLLTAKQEAVDSGIVAPSWRMGTPALVRDGSIAYRTLRPTDPDRTVFEFGVYAHGPNAAGLAEQLAEQIHVWAAEHRDGRGPRLEVHPAGTPDTRLPSGPGTVVMDKRHTRIALSWPDAR